MCDIDNLARNAKFDWSLNRRHFVSASAGLALTAYASTGSAAASLSEDMAEVTTSDGTMDAFFARPSSGKHPAVITWPDIAGLRDAFKVMARRLAKQGYAVLVINPYYRAKPAPQFKDFAEFAANDGFETVKPWRAALTPAAIMSDATAAMRWLDARSEVDSTRGAFTNGYCMGGPFAVFTAAAVPERIRAAASLHGAGLVKAGDPESPDRLIGRSRASFLFAIAQNDDAKAPTDKQMLKQAAAEARRPAEIEVYPADHGWTVIDSQSYEKNSAERAWTEMSHLFHEATSVRA